jgi:hypothetical protein
MTAFPHGLAKFSGFHRQAPERQDRGMIIR